MQKYTVKIDDSGDSGDIRWYKEGANILHRENGPAVEYANGDKVWYQNNKRHREDGPAVEYSNGDKFWYQDNKLHRVDGPAIEFANGTKKWYIEGKQYTEAEFNNFINKDTPTCEGKRVIIEGKTYKLILVD